MLIEASFGTAAAFFNPASTGLVPQTVPEGEVQQAYAANSVVFNAAELVGPAIATEEHYGSTGVYGAIATAMGAGTVIGSLAGLRWRPRHAIRFAMS